MTEKKFDPFPDPSQPGAARIAGKWRSEQGNERPNGRGPSSLDPIKNNRGTPVSPLTIPAERNRIPGRNRNCGRFTLHGANSEEAVYHRLNCKVWDCPRCGPRNARLYKRAIREAAERYELRRFLTLTLDPQKLGGRKPVVHTENCVRAENARFTIPREIIVVST